MGWRLLFVCSGNICRSPMAEGIARRRADELGLDVEARSAGTLGIVDRPADPKAVAVCRELGVDIAGHRSQGVSNELIAWADRIVVMELEHATHLRNYYPAVGEKVLLLGPFGGVSDIDDPLGGWTFTFRRNRRLIETCVDAMLRRLGRR